MRHSLHTPPPDGFGDEEIELTKRHEERYQRRLERITAPLRERTLTRAMKELGLEKYPTAPSDRIALDRLVNHKLGIRQH